jgi:low affinity Fe/Cu permease
MCYSKEVSLVTFTLGTIGSYLVYNLGSATDKILGGYLGYVSLMQLIELLLWSHQTCDSYHKSVSISGMILNLTQPIVLAALVLHFSKRAGAPIYWIIGAYSLFIMYYVTEYTSDLHCTSPKENDPHLVWNWGTLPSYKAWWILYVLTSTGISILGMPILMQGIQIAAWMIITMSISILVYPRQDMGAMWCFFTAFTPLLYYLSRTWHQAQLNLA